MNRRLLHGSHIIQISSFQTTCASIPISQLDSVHPSTHVHVLGEVHSLLVPQDGLHFTIE